MTKNEILNKTTWDDYEIGTCFIYVPLFEKEIPFVFFQNHEPTPSITDKMLACVNDILELEKSAIETIKEMLWEECIFSFTIGDYGYEPNDDETHLEAHLKGFKISNKDDAYAKSVVKEIQIDEKNDELSGRYAEIKINSASDNLIAIIVKNGKLIDFDYDGTYLPSFEIDEQCAKKNREETIK
ncbi:hypothetical protein FAZ19_15710 [Sphingobacterium alkalisoli]|uniref:DUF2262 domain-containing protein n=1 Tax=Sphingobacterium alkalisoli TaxID=1874115 RepID=A0A4U0GX63_9SPHI|nr:hypothetical protein [Sphingobacterium alkalisoli]TJY63717.1 hypothetical protein FAZ19_15710 [Sphingobacterium alkalisoli]GGH25315.1 hypothetical protein GCM10011418_33860 [Sphingobacterium alkalisoli]